LLFIVYTTLGGAIFSLWVIGWSVIFTRAAGLLFRLLGILNSLSPWIWLALVFVVAAFIYLFRRMGWKTFPSPHSSTASKGDRGTFSPVT